MNPVTVEDSPGGEYRAVANGIWDVMHIEVTLEVSSAGRIQPASQRPLADRLDIVPA